MVIILYRVLNPRARILQVIEVHRGANVDAGVKCKEPGLGNGRNLRGIFQVEEDEAGALALISREVGRFRLEVRQN